MIADLKHELSKIFPEQAPESLGRFARYWLSRRRGRAMPSRKDIDPVDIPWALSKIFMLHRSRSGRIVYRLVGEEVNWMLGRGIKGKTADQVFEPEYARFTEQRWERAMRQKLICFNGSFHLTVDNVPRFARRVMLPLSDDGVIVDQLIGLVHFDRPVQKSERIRDPASKFLYWTEIDSLG